MIEDLYRKGEQQIEMEGTYDVYSESVRKKGGRQKKWVVDDRKA
jgi:hypothetical protein